MIFFNVDTTSSIIRLASWVDSKAAVAARSTVGVGVLVGVGVSVGVLVGEGVGVLDGVIVAVALGGGVYVAVGASGVEARLQAALKMAKANNRPRENQDESFL